MEIPHIWWFGYGVQVLKIFSMELLDGITKIIGLVGGVSGLGALIWYAINLRSKRKAEKAITDKKVAEAELIEAEVWAKKKDTLKDEANASTEFIKMYYNDIGVLKKRMNGLTRVVLWSIGEGKKEEIFHCKKFNCPDRDPALGTYQRDYPNWVREILDEMSGIENDN